MSAALIAHCAGTQRFKVQCPPFDAFGYASAKNGAHIRYGGEYQLRISHVVKRRGELEHDVTRGIDLVMSHKPTSLCELLAEFIQIRPGWPELATRRTKDLRGHLAASPY